MTIGTVLSVVGRIHPSAASQEFSNAVLVVVEIDVGMNVVHPETLKDPVVVSIFGTLLSLLTTAVVAFVLLGNSTSVSVAVLAGVSTSVITGPSTLRLLGADDTAICSLVVRSATLIDFPLR